MVDESSSTVSSSSATYPRKVKMNLALELELKDEEQERYLFASESGGVLQIGFIADLFDLLNFEATLGVEKINGFTNAQVTKVLQAGL